MITIDVNGTQHQIEIEQDTPLRDVVGLTGTKFGCGTAACGCCTVHIGVGG
jgi:isoquinoline 1-oxidoreductase alpha subunit